MTQNLQQQLPALTTETLTPIVRKSTGRDTAKIIDWKVDILHGASPNSGIFRFAGNALDQDINLPWSLILKIVQPTEDADNSVSLRYWKREDLTPEGDEFIFSSSKDGSADLYTMNLKNNTIKKLTSSQSIEVSPAVSPDGKYIVFVSDRGGSPQIYTMRGDG